MPVSRRTSAVFPWSMCPAVPTTTGRTEGGPGRSGLDAADRRPERLELLLQPLVAAVEVVDARDPGFAAGDETGQDERRGGAEIGRHDGRAAQHLDAADVGRVPLEADVGAEALKLGQVREAVEVDRVDDRA